ncbi:hypothetical protein GCM10025791_47050 [Halioxenophilus aromaticivorans]|uniref:Uncharacterized protein n=1 Tax=Halioxenophilus aromaticivorans TaxID=1306992 RepID=A0AAV3U9R1_9ALTE
MPATVSGQPALVTTLKPIATITAMDDDHTREFTLNRSETEPNQAAAAQSKCKSLCKPALTL